MSAVKEPAFSVLGLGPSKLLDSILGFRCFHFDLSFQSVYPRGATSKESQHSGTTTDLFCQDVTWAGRSHLRYSRTQGRADWCPALQGLPFPTRARLQQSRTLLLTPSHRTSHSAHHHLERTKPPKGQFIMAVDISGTTNIHWCWRGDPSRLLKWPSNHLTSGSSNIFIFLLRNLEL